MKLILAIAALVIATIAASAVNVTLAWAPNPPSQNVTKYDVLASTNGGPYTVLASTTETSFIIPSMPNGSYGFQVRAVNMGGTSSACSPVTTPSLPGAVETPLLSVTNGNDLTLSWNPKPADQWVTSYKVWMSTNSGEYAEVAEVAGTAKAFPGMPPGQYSFKVQAINLAGAGPFSPAVNSPSAPGVPAGLTLTITN